MGCDYKKMTCRIFVMVVLAAGVVACSESNKNSVQSADQKSEFGVFCDSFTSITERQDFANMSPTHRYNLLNAELEQKLGETSSAYIAWLAIATANPSIRYKLLEDAAHSVGESHWHCESALDHIAEVNP